MKTLTLSIVILALSGCATPYQLERANYDRADAEAKTLIAENPALCKWYDTSSAGRPSLSTPGYATSRDSLGSVTGTSEAYKQDLAMWQACRRGTVEGRAIAQQESKETVGKVIGSAALIGLSAAADATSPTVYEHTMKLPDGRRYRTTHKLYDNRNTRAAVGTITGIRPPIRYHKVEK